MPTAAVRQRIELFFRDPIGVIGGTGTYGVLFLLRRDILKCFSIDPETGKQFESAEKRAAYLPAAMCDLAGIDLLAKFHSGSDHVGGVAPRFKNLLTAHGRLSQTDADTIYQLRNSLLHSFGWYSHAAGATYRFRLSRDLGLLVVQVGPIHYIDVVALNELFEDVIADYRKLLDSELSAGLGVYLNRFDGMFGNYGAVEISQPVSVISGPTTASVGSTLTRPITGAP